MQFKIGDVVKNKLSPDWGVGKVIEVRSTDMAIVQFTNKDKSTKMAAKVLEIAHDLDPSQINVGSEFENFIGKTIVDMLEEHKKGQEIYSERKKHFQEKGRNTQEWREDVRGDDFRKIVKFCGGSIIPYCLFCYVKEVFFELFKDKESVNYGNFIFYNINMGVARKELEETPEGLKYKGQLRERGLHG